LIINFSPLHIFRPPNIIITEYEHFYDIKDIKFYKGDKMRKLPSIFKNNEVPKQHNVEYCLVLEKTDIKRKLDNLFEELGPIYKKRVLIKTKDREFETYIIKRYNGFIKTVENNIISENDIESIKRIK
jgi:hypothetical protein